MSAKIHVILFGLISLIIGTTPLMGQKDIKDSIVIEGVKRIFYLHLPPDYEQTSTLPLVFNFHGFTSNARQQEINSGMNAVADTAKFIVCYPEGIDASWNVGWTFGSKADDVGFTSIMIDVIHEKYGVDLKKVYACGMSNGGFMSYELACKSGDKIAAIASVTGSMIPNALNVCKPIRPIPILEIHGNADLVVNYDGTPFISMAIKNVLKFWQTNNGCDAIPTITPFPDINNQDGTQTEVWHYQNCILDQKVVHYKINGGGHTWPGSVGGFGATSQDFSASSEIWNFFKQYTLPTISSDEDIFTESITISPNPFHESLRVDTGQEDHVSLRIIDACGRILKTEMLKAGENNIATTNLQSGMYVIYLSSKKVNQTSKLIKI